MKITFLQYKAIVSHSQDLSYDCIRLRFLLLSCATNLESIVAISKNVSKSSLLMQNALYKMQMHPR